MPKVIKTIAIVPSPEATTVVFELFPSVVSSSYLTYKLLTYKLF